MSIRYKRDDIPKPCKNCDNLHCSYVYMDGSAVYNCSNSEYNLKYFRNGKCCKESKDGNYNKI